MQKIKFFMDFFKNFSFLAPENNRNWEKLFSQTIGVKNNGKTHAFQRIFVTTSKKSFYFLSREIQTFMSTFISLRLKTQELRILGLAKTRMVFLALCVAQQLVLLAKLKLVAIFPSLWKYRHLNSTEFAENHRNSLIMPNIFVTDCLSFILF